MDGQYQSARMVDPARAAELRRNASVGATFPQDRDRGSRLENRGGVINSPNGERRVDSESKACDFLARAHAVGISAHGVPVAARSGAAGTLGHTPVPDPRTPNRAGLQVLPRQGRQGTASA